MRSSGFRSGLMIVGLAMAFVLGCGEGKPKKYILGFSQCTIEEPWRLAMNNDIEVAASLHQDEIQLKTLVAGDDSNVQADNVRSFTASGVDVLVVSPKESSPLTAPVCEAHEAGIPVILLDRNVDRDCFTAWIGGDNMEIGREAGRFVVEKAREKINETGQETYSVLMIQGNKGTKPCTDRREGFLEVIKEEPRIKLVVEDPKDCDWKRAKAIDYMESVLSAFPNAGDIDCVYAHNDPMAIGAYLAAENAGREDEMIFVGVDGLRDEGVRAVLDGQLAATFIYPTCGAEAINTALRILRGEEVTLRQKLPTSRITKANAQEWYNRLPPSAR